MKDVLPPMDPGKPIILWQGSNGWFVMEFRGKTNGLATREIMSFNVMGFGSSGSDDPSVPSLLPFIQKHFEGVMP